MLDQIYNVPQTASEILGDLTGLAERLGSADGLCPLSVAAASIGSAQVGSVPALRRFLAEYTAGLLIPMELASVAGAYQHCCRYQIRELIALDTKLGRAPVLPSFANASCRVGRTQLRRLRPLRDDRMVQRYFNAVEAGEAQGWHTLVFGLVLATYSLPLRQGLSHFAQRTVAGFVESAGKRFTVADAEREELLSAVSGPISRGIENVIAEHLPAATCFGGTRPDV